MILVLRSAQTTRDAALLAKQRFLDDGIPVMGTILNNWNPNTPGYGYYRNYYEGYFHYLGDGTAATARQPERPQQEAGKDEKVHVLKSMRQRGAETPRSIPSMCGIAGIFRTGS